MLTFDRAVWANLPCYADETSPEGDDISVPRFDGENYSMTSRMPLDYAPNVLHDRIHFCVFTFVSL
jgi:hypothetical protein